MKRFIYKVKKEKGNTLAIGNYQYILQSYNEGSCGNIKRMNGTVLCKFYIDDVNQIIDFCFQKVKSPFEFDYTKYSIPFCSKVETIGKIPNNNAKELLHVLDTI